MTTVDEIYQKMLKDFGTRTGMEPVEGCDLSARLYAAAAQVNALYIQADWVARQAFPQTAEGEALDRHAQLRNLERKAASPARGTVRFTAGERMEQDRQIPAGTVCMTAGLVRFETTAEAVIPAGSLSVDAPVRALSPGKAGNVGARTIVAMAVAPVGISGCLNPEPCTGGEDEESDEGLRERILATFRRLPNGANSAFYQQGAMSFEGVAGAAVVPRPRGRGTVDVVVSSADGLPPKELLDQLRDYFQVRREIAVDVQVRAPETVAVNLSVRVKAGPGFDPGAVRTGVEQVLRSQFTGKLLGKSILRAWLGNVIYSCEGVENYEIAAPAADVLVEKDRLPVLGTLTVEEMT